MNYTPTQTTLKRYAEVLINFALGYGKGVKKGETVFAVISENARPLMLEIRKAVARAGGNLILRYIPSDEDRFAASKDFYKLAGPAQLDFAPERYFQGVVDQCDHVLMIVSANPKGLSGVDSKKVTTHTNSQAIIRKLYAKKEQKGALTWCGALYGTPELAKEAGLSVEKYWEQIIQACFLDKRDPIAEWSKVFRSMERTKKKLDALQIECVKVEGPDVDLQIKIGEKRQWVRSSGQNIPSFEVFCSPDWRGTEGWIRFNQPLYYLGNKISGIELWFEKGRVVKSKAKVGEKLLQNMIQAPGANKVGEFSLTDKRLSRITKFMAHTLYDENVGGPDGNTHIALGNAYKESYAGDISKLDSKMSKKLGFNESLVHTDMMSTAPRTVTAFTRAGKKTVIYKDGKYIL